MWKFSIFLWGLFLGLLVFGWKLMLLFAFLTVLAGLADYQLLQNRRKKQKEYDQKAQELMEREAADDQEIITLTVVPSKPKRKKKTTKTTQKATKTTKKKPSEKKIDDKLADLEQEIDKLSHEIKGAKDTDFPSATDEAQPAEQIERLSQKLSALKAEHQKMLEQ